ncbi:MAG TPA: hypothetical protein PL041_12965 [Melioribacteraceae bacterium]|nr:hypothetical protein [Melioribacteraceae bacterium]
MKKLITTLSLFVIIFTGCDVNINEYENDRTPPTAPKNVYSVTGDNEVYLYWDSNRESDLAGYKIYYSYSYNGTYYYIGSTSKTNFIDNEAKNGTTYYYAITAYDRDGNESELSIEEVFDTPRPEGFNQAIFEFHQFENTSGYSFKDYLVVPYNSANVDFFFEKYNNKFYLDVFKDSDIQDMGATQDIYDISYAPLNGYVPINEGENIKYVEAKIGHTYVIWTYDNHFAKVRVKNITNERLVFDWAYQTAEGNRELKRMVDDFRENLTNIKIIRN